MPPFRTAFHYRESPNLHGHLELTEHSRPFVALETLYGGDFMIAGTKDRPKHDLVGKDMSFIFA